MGLLDKIGNFGNKLELAFLPAKERAQVEEARENVLLRKFQRDQAIRQQDAISKIGEAAFPDIAPSVIKGSSENASSNLNLGGAANSLINSKSTPGVDNSQQRNLLNLISTLSPQAGAQFAGNVLSPGSKKGRASLTERFAEANRLTIALGGDPLGLDAFNQFAGLSESGKDAAVRELTELEIEAAKNKIQAQINTSTDRDTGLEEKRIAKAKREQSIVDRITLATENIDTAFNASANLLNTGGETGFIGQGAIDTAVKVGAQVGFPGAREVQINRDDFGKASANLLLGVFKDLADEDIIAASTLSNAESAIAGFGVNPVTNAGILKSQARVLVRTLNREGLGAEQVKVIEKIIRNIELFERANRPSKK